MKYLSLLITLIILAGGSKVRIREVTSQEWAGGLPESGYGTDYTVTLIAKGSSDHLRIEGIWVEDLFIPVKIAAAQGVQGAKTFARGEKLMAKGGLVFRPDENGQVTLRLAEKRLKPIDYKGSGLLQYNYKGVTKYQVIKSIKVLEKLIYP